MACSPVRLSFFAFVVCRWMQHSFRCWGKKGMAAVHVQAQHLLSYLAWLAGVEVVCSLFFPGLLMEMHRSCSVMLFIEVLFVSTGCSTSSCCCACLRPVQHQCQLSECISHQWMLGQTDKRFRRVCGVPPLYRQLYHECEECRVNSCRPSTASTNTWLGKYKHVALGYPVEQGDGDASSCRARVQDRCIWLKCHRK